jgi:hypothetical protein
VAAAGIEEKLNAAREIREVVHQYLRASSEQARAHLPSDWASMLPRDIGVAEVDSDGSVRIGAWRLQASADGELAQLDYYPPASTSARRHRVWFRMQLARSPSSGGRWEVLPPGVSFVHAWPKER